MNFIFRTCQWKLANIPSLTPSVYVVESGWTRLPTQLATHIPSHLPRRRDPDSATDTRPLQRPITGPSAATLRTPKTTTCQSLLASHLLSLPFLFPAQTCPDLLDEDNPHQYYKPVSFSYRYPCCGSCLSVQARFWHSLLEYATTRQPLHRMYTQPDDWADSGHPGAKQN